MLHHKHDGRRAGTAPGGEGGFTLLEVLIAAALTGMLAIPLMFFTFKGLSSFAYLTAQSNTSTELSTLSERMAKVIRGTTSIISAGNNTLTIYGYFSPQDTTVKQIRYFISGNNLEIGVTPPSGTAPNYTFPSANEVVTITRVDLSMGSTPMFTYYDDSGNKLTGSFTTSQIKAIGIYVAANPDAAQVNVPIAVNTRVTLRNFKTNL